MSDRQPRYRSYVLRLWQVRSEGERAWRASLQTPDGDERHAFADLQSLFLFLHQAVGLPIEAEREKGVVDGDGARDEEQDLPVSGD